MRFQKELGLRSDKSRSLPIEKCFEIYQVFKYFFSIGMESAWMERWIEKGEKKHQKGNKFLGSREMLMRCDWADNIMWVGRTAVRVCCCCWCCHEYISNIHFNLTHLVMGLGSSMFTTLNPITDPFGRQGNSVTRTYKVKRRKWKRKFALCVRRGITCLSV